MFTLFWYDDYILFYQTQFLIFIELIEESSSWILKEFIKIPELYRVFVIFTAEVCFSLERQNHRVKAEIFRTVEIFCH